MIRVANTRLSRLLFIISMIQFVYVVNDNDWKY